MGEIASGIPVIIGVGQLCDRPEDPEQGLNSIGLMEAALRLADADAGGGWLTSLDSLAVVDQISFPDLADIPGQLSDRLGAKPRIRYKTHLPEGNSPILLLNEAANRIGAGEIQVAAVVGGEALRTAARRVAASTDSNRNDSRDTADAAASDYCKRYGLVAPVEIYPLYENACRAAFGQTMDEGQLETAKIWEGFSRIAVDNPGAWIRKPVSAREIMTPSIDNRRISFPYLKLMVANSAVNQGAGFIVTSLERARAAGVPEQRLIYIGRGAAANESYNFLARDGYDHSTSMAVSLRRTLELNRVTVADLDFVELYSCFPCVPKMARRVIGWPVEKPATVFGGLTFGGGPIGNYMSHAVVGMVDKLRRSGRCGLLFANGGFATNNHSIVLFRDPAPAGTFPQNFDFQAEADAQRGSVPALVENYIGPGSIETYTVLYNRKGTVHFGVVVGRTPSGDRFLAKVPATDEAGIAFLSGGGTEPVGSAGEAITGEGGDIYWRR